MKTKISTSVNQSKKLIELGIDVNTADMMWTYDFTIGHINGLNVISTQLKPEENDIPAWSLSALIELLSYGDILCMGKAAKDDGYLWISLTQSLPNNPLIRDNEVYPSMIDMILEKYIYPSLQSK